MSYFDITKGRSNNSGSKIRKQKDITNSWFSPNPIRGSLHKFLKDLWNFTCKQLLQFYHYLGVSINSGDFKSNFKVIFGYFYLEQDLTISSQALTEEKLNCVGPAMYLGFVFPSVNQCTITYQWLEIGRRPYMVCSFYLTSNYYILERFEQGIRC